MVESARKVRPQVIQARLGLATPERVAAFCRAHGIVWLALFGSVLRDDLQGLVAGRKRTDLDTGRLFELAALHLVQTIGEAATKVARETRALHPDIPWGRLSGCETSLCIGMTQWMTTSSGRF